MKANLLSKYKSLVIEEETLIEENAALQTKIQSGKRVLGKFNETIASLNKIRIPLEDHRGASNVKQIAAFLIDETYFDKKLANQSTRVS